MCACLSSSPYWGLGLQSRHTPCLGIKPATLLFAGQHSILSHTSQDIYLIFKGRKHHFYVVPIIIASCFRMAGRRRDWKAFPFYSTW